METKKQQAVRDILAKYGYGPCPGCNKTENGKMTKTFTLCVECETERISGHLVAVKAGK